MPHSCAPSAMTGGAGPCHAVCITSSTTCQLGDPFPAVGMERIRSQRGLARAPRCPSRTSTSTAGMCATEVLFHMRGALGCVGFMHLAPQALCCVAA